MSREVPNATSQADGYELSVGRRTDRQVRRLGLGVALAVALVLGVASAASASSNFYWYGESPDCWQTGTLGAGNHACDYPGGGELHEAITGDLNAPQSGDYCNTYNVPASCANQDAVWPLSFDTELEPCPSLKGPACGAQHYVSLNSQEADLPWSSSFGEPALVVSAELAIKITKPAYAWAYLCPVLKAPKQPYYLEICFDEWQGSKTQSNLPEPPFASRGYGLNTICAPVTVNKVGSSIDQLVSPFALNQSTPYGTTLSGSANTGSGEGTSKELFTAKIALKELKNVITRDNQTTNPEDGGSPEYNNTGNKYGCHRGLSEELSGYRLVGIQDGTEGYPDTNTNATTSTLKAWTEYTPLPPEAITEPASGITEVSASLNGKVNPKGTATKYYFQYGETPSYGHSTSPSEPAGSGEGFITATPTTISGLKPGVTYYYRIVAQGAGEPVYGKEHTFVTLEQPDAFFADATDGGSMSSWTWSEPSHWQMRNFLRDQIAAKSSPSALVWGGVPYVFFADKNDNGELSDWAWSSTEGWQLKELFKDELEANTSPAALMVNGLPNVFFSDKQNKGELSDWNWNSTEGWHITHMGGDEAVAGTSPTALMISGTPNVFFSDKSYNGEISDLKLNSKSEWEMQRLYVDPVAAGTSPVALMVGSTPSVFFVDKENKDKISEWTYVSGWKMTKLGGSDEVVASTGPTAIMYSGGPNVFFSDKNDSGEVGDLTLNSKSEWETQRLNVDEVAPETSPSATVVNNIPYVLFADGKNSDDVSYFTRSATEGWHMTKLAGDKVAAGSSPYALPGGASYDTVRTFATLEQPDVFFADANYGGAIGDWWDSSSGWQSQNLFEDQVAAKSSPSAVVWGGAPNVFFADAWDNGELSDWAWSSAEGWHLQNMFKDAVEPGTSPTAVIWNGEPNVFFSDAHDNGSISDLSWNSTEGWHITELLSTYPTVGTSPSAIVVNGVPEVFFEAENRSNTLAYWSWSSKGWYQTFLLGDSVASGSSPSAVVVNGTPNVFFSDADDNGEITDWTPSSEEWHHLWVDGVAAKTSPSAIVASGKPYVFFSDGIDNGEISVWTWNSKSEWAMKNLFQDEAEPETSPGAVAFNGTPYAFFADKKDNGSISYWTEGSPGSWQLNKLYWDQVAAGSSPDALE
jgi:hypothetical protein